MTSYYRENGNVTAKSIDKQLKLDYGIPFIKHMG